MYLTPHRISRQIERADKLQRILWRLYSPYKKHRKLIVKASAHAIEMIELLEELLEQVTKDYKEELEHPLPSTSIVPGGYDKEKADDNSKSISS